MAGEVGVPVVVTLIGVVLQMADAEADCRRQDIWQIGSDRCQFVQPAVSEDQVMGCFVNDHVKAVVGKSADQICRDQRQPPIRCSKVSHERRQADLQQDNRSQNCRGPGIASHEIADIRMLPQDRFGSFGMRLGGRGKIKGAGHGGFLRHPTLPRAEVDGKYFPSKPLA